MRAGISAFRRPAKQALSTSHLFRQVSGFGTLFGTAYRFFEALFHLRFQQYFLFLILFNFSAECKRT